MIQSMTGFGAQDGDIVLPSGSSATWRWEIKSVNGRGLDVRFRTPSGYDRLEQNLRSLAKPLGRGSVSAHLDLTIATVGGPFAVDEEALSAAIEIASRVRDQLEGATLSVDGLLSVRGVLAPTDQTLLDDDQAALDMALEDSFSAAVIALRSAREREGAVMATALIGQLDAMTDHIRSAKQGAAEAVGVHFSGLRAQIADLLGDTSLSPERLTQEAAMLATKSDVQEEIDRLEGHVEAARTHFADGGIAGRALDFLAQEFMREANTLTVKSPTLEMKKTGLALKGLVDQFKEQVQNIA